MSTIDDIKKLLECFVSSDLKALKVEVDALRKEMDLRFDVVLARMDTQHATVIFSLNIGGRLEAVERKTADKTQ